MIAFLGGIAWVGLNASFGRGASFGVVLALLVAGYAARAFLDSIFRVHIIEEFLFFIGYAMGLRSAELTNG